MKSLEVSRGRYRIWLSFVAQELARKGKRVDDTLEGKGSDYESEMGSLTSTILKNCACSREAESPTEREVDK
jgi:hypothetical protein